MIFLGLTAEDASRLGESKAFVETLGITWPNAYGAGETVEAFRVGGLPALFVIGADGRVLWNGEMDGTLEDALEAALWLRDHPES